MTATSADIVTKALERIAVKDQESEVTAAEMATGKEDLTSLWAEFKTTHGVTVAWDLETVPDALLFAMGAWLAAEIAPSYSRPMPEPRHRAVARLRAYLLPDDRTDPADYDGDGTVTAAEQAAYDRAAFY